MTTANPTTLFKWYAHVTGPGEPCFSEMIWAADYAAAREHASHLLDHPHRGMPYPRFCKVTIDPEDRWEAAKLPDGTFLSRAEYERRFAHPVAAE